MPKSRLGVDGLPLLKPELAPLMDLRPTEGVRVDLERCIIPTGLLGCERDKRLPVEVAAFSLWTVGFSGTGRGILDSQGKSGEGGACNLGEGLLEGPATMPSATFWISLLHLSQSFNLDVGCSVSGVVKGLP